jgi:hypothetical protein
MDVKFGASNQISYYNPGIKLQNGSDKSKKYREPEKNRNDIDILWT